MTPFSNTDLRDECRQTGHITRYNVVFVSVIGKDAGIKGVLSALQHPLRAMRCNCKVKNKHFLE